MYSVDSADSLSQVDPWLEQLSANCNNPNVHKILVGNKSDLEKSQRKVTLKEGKEVADMNGMEFYEVSAMLNEGGITGMFTEVIEKIRKKYTDAQLSGGSPFAE